MSRLLRAFVGVSMIATVQSASGAMISDTLPVTASVNAVCMIDLSGKELAFGTYTPLSPRNANVALGVRCTAGTTATMTIVGGGSRAMTSSGTGGTLNYTAALSDGTLSAPAMSRTADVNGNVAVSVTGNIPATQYVPAANDYRDDLVIEVSF
jgi:hypothetical protein